jgi:hypothetical protein
MFLLMVLKNDWLCTLSLYERTITLVAPSSLSLADTSPMYFTSIIKSGWPLQVLNEKSPAEPGTRFK